MWTNSRITLLLLASLACSLPAQQSPDAPPNILLLFADDMRRDTIAALGNPRIQTPNLDRLVREGFTFSNNYCMGSRHGAVCAPSRAMLMSGRYLPRVSDSLEGVVTLGEQLARAGYATFATGKWHNGKDSFQRSFASGRNIMFGGMSDHRRVPIVDLPGGSDRFTETRTAESFSSELFADAAIEFLEKPTARTDRLSHPTFGGSTVGTSIFRP
ncbi:MAG: sulfatase-like hydrolase/transferase [Planctomycetota bacterium]|jgi:arylsulfatase A-like enzyme